MEEILQKLLASDLLGEETKTELTEAWAEAVASKKAELREEVALEVRSELVEQFTVARDALVDKVESFIAEQMESELADLRGDIERFRDLEVEMAVKLAEEKEVLAEEARVAQDAAAQKLDEEINSLVDKIDQFLEVRLSEDMEDLKEDIQLVKANDFGRRIMEAFAAEYSAAFVDEDSVQAKLAIAESKLADAAERLQEVEREKDVVIRESKMQDVLAPLTGSKREQMKFVLQNVETQKLEEAYKYFIGRVLKESSDDKKATGEPVVIAESVLATGDKLVEAEQAQTESIKPDMSYIKRLAGI